jgi:predicted DNA-binding transcriptional regulator YafY
MEPAVSRAAEASAGPPDAHGWVRVVLPIEGLGHATAELLRLGAEAEVLEPAALRDRLAGTAEAMAAVYH